MSAAKRLAPWFLGLLLLAAGPASAQPADNPLLGISPQPLRYPPFDQLRDAHIAPALDRGMADQLAEVQAIADNPAAPTFDNTIVAMERSGRLLERTATLLWNLVETDATPAREQLQTRYAPTLAAHRSAIQLHPGLQARIEALHAAGRDAAPSAEAWRLIGIHRRNLVRAGARLDAAQKTRMQAINTELAALAAQYRGAARAEANDSALVVDSADDLAGMDPAQIDAAAAAARQRGLTGKFLLALQSPTIQPLEAVLHNRALRERLHRASVARGARGNANDTTAIVARVLALRQERAALLGHPTAAAFVLEEETAGTPDAVNTLLRRLVPAALASARRDAAELQALIDREQAAAGQPGFALQPWDWSYYAEKLRATRDGFDAAELQPYLALRNVLERGVFHAATQLYGIGFKRRTDLPRYRDDLLVYEVADTDGKPLGIFIADLYAHPGKSGGAWMSGYVWHDALEGTLPVVANHLNIPKPPPGAPTLLTWAEVRTLFHEFGHALHGLFDRSPYPGLSRLPRDFVEYPSQVNEVWRAWPGVLAHYARHHQTGAPMPDALLDKLARARPFNEAYETLSYLSAAMLDQRLHQLRASQLPAADALLAFEARVLKDEGLDFGPVPPRYRTPYFSHIMGGYPAGYYGYIWSEVLDADTVDWLRARGGLNRANGDLLRARLLARGGSDDPMQLFRDLVGRPPRIEPLLQRRGLVLPGP